MIRITRERELGMEPLACGHLHPLLPNCTNCRSIQTAKELNGLSRTQDLRYVTCHSSYCPYPPKDYSSRVAHGNRKIDLFHSNHVSIVSSFEPCLHCIFFRTMSPSEENEASNHVAMIFSVYVAILIRTMSYLPFCKVK